MYLQIILILFSINTENSEIKQTPIPLSLQMQNLNIIAYIIYLLVSFYVTIKVGWMCYQNGRVYLEDIFGHHPSWVTPINKLLLTGYYLINLGYIAFNLNDWENITTPLMMTDVLILKLGFLLVVLGALHYFNIWVLAQLAKHSMFSNK